MLLKKPKTNISLSGFLPYQPLNPGCRTAHVFTLHQHLHQAVGEAQILLSLPTSISIRSATRSGIDHGLIELHTAGVKRRIPNRWNSVMVGAVDPHVDEMRLPPATGSPAIFPNNQPLAHHLAERDHKIRKSLNAPPSIERLLLRAR